MEGELTFTKHLLCTWYSLYISKALISIQFCLIANYSLGVEECNVENRAFRVFEEWNAMDCNVDEIFEMKV